MAAVAAFCQPATFEVRDRFTGGAKCRDRHTRMGLLDLNFGAGMERDLPGAGKKVKVRKLGVGLERSLKDDEETRWKGERETKIKGLRESRRWSGRVGRAA